MNVFIYYLSDEKCNIRYVGKTKNHPRKRLYAHIKESKGSSISHKNNWLKKIISKGERPMIKVIDEVPEEEWEFWEEYWISQFKTWGFNLTNLTPSGYNNNYKRSKETKKKMKNSKLGTKLSDSHKKKISKSVKGKYKENPNYNRTGGNLKKQIDRELLYQLYIIENLSTTKIADKLKLSKKKVWQSLQEYKIKKDKKVWKKQLSSGRKKPVIQYDLNGIFVKEWESPVQIYSELGYNKSNISNVCRGVAKTANGFIWKYKKLLNKEILF